MHVLNLPGGVWDKCGAKVLPLGTAEHPVRKMLVVPGGKIWCTTANVVKVVSVAEAEVETSFAVRVREDGDHGGSKDEKVGAERSVLSLTHSGLAVWLAVERSAKVLAYHVAQPAPVAPATMVEAEPLTEIKVTGVVNKVLAGECPSF